MRLRASPLTAPRQAVSGEAPVRESMKGGYPRIATGDKPTTSE